jgi:hypothetical protein
VDRRLNPHVERKILAKHPDQKKTRGTVVFWNFIPPDDLDLLLRLYGRVSLKTLRISKVFGIEGKKLLKPTDDFDALKDFIHSYEGVMTPLEQMHLEYQKLIAQDAGLEDKLDELPGRVFSGKQHTTPGTRAVFLCYNLPGEDKTAGKDAAEEVRWTEEAGKTAWYLFDLGSGNITDKPEEIVGLIRSTPETPRSVCIPQPDLREVRLKVEKHITNTYLKQVQAPMGIKPILKCWMELN